jgi:flagellar protein FlaG
MIDGVSVNNDNLVINKGSGAPLPPSSPEINSSVSGQAAAELNLNTRVADDSNKKSERVAKSQTEEAEEKQLKDVIQSLNDKLEQRSREIQFKLDKKIDRHYISVIDKQSKEVIREFPPEEIRTFIARFDEFNEKMNTSDDVKSLIINLEV